MFDHHVIMQHHFRRLMHKRCFQLQDLQTPELQPLSLESKAALALLKYLPLNTKALSQVSPFPFEHRIASNCIANYIVDYHKPEANGILPADYSNPAYSQRRASG